MVIKSMKQTNVKNDLRYMSEWPGSATSSLVPDDDAHGCILPEPNQTMSRYVRGKRDKCVVERAAEGARKQEKALVKEGEA